MKTLIFTDLDGTLLNHDDYSYKGAKDALKLISKKNIPLIFTTSKTKSEVEKLQKKLKIKEPFIIENGAALFIPKGYHGLDLGSLKEFGDYRVLVFGKTYEQILTFYDKYKIEFGMYGFSDMSIKEVAKYTGLGPKSSERSKQRDFTEPFVLKDSSKLEKLKNLALTCNLKITRGGRFYHLMGMEQDKGKAVKKTIKLFKKLYNKKILSIALGDGENDIPMLENVDMPINIKNHKGKYLNTKIKDLQYSTYRGSPGFNEMVLKNVK